MSRSRLFFFAQMSGSRSGRSKLTTLSTSEWTALHSSSFAKGHACCGCSLASALPTPPLRCQPFANGHEFSAGSPQTPLPKLLKAADKSRNYFLYSTYQAWRHLRSGSFCLQKFGCIARQSNRFAPAGSKSSPRQNPLNSTYAPAKI